MTVQCYCDGFSVVVVVLSIDERRIERVERCVRERERETEREREKERER